MLERITGYLVGGTNKWNNGKKSELKDRVSHISGEKMVKDMKI
jgi:ribonucleoside-triphosphate reductase